MVIKILKNMLMEVAVIVETGHQGLAIGEECRAWLMQVKLYLKAQDTKYNQTMA